MHIVTIAHPALLHIDPLPLYRAIINPHPFNIAEVANKCTYGLNLIDIVSHELRKNKSNIVIMQFSKVLSS